MSQKETPALSVGWLTKRLRHHKHLGTGRVTQLIIHPSFTSTAATLTPLTLSYSTDAANHPPQQLMYKEFHPTWQEGAQAEQYFYQTIPSQLPTSIAPACYDIGKTADHNIYFLLTDLSQTHVEMPWPLPTNTPSQSQLQQAIIQLSHLHIHFWQHPHLNQDRFVRRQGGPLVMAHATTAVTLKQYQQQFQNVWQDRWQTLGSSFTHDDQQLCQQALSAWPPLFQHRMTENNHLTLIHGDFHLWNIHFPHNFDKNQPQILDWETYKRGLGVYDIAYLLISSLSIERRRQMERPLLHHYHQSLQNAGIHNYTWDHCLHDYRLAIIANLFPPLAWGKIDVLKSALQAFHNWHCQELLDISDGSNRKSSI